MKIIMLCLGTRGDVQPYVAIGQTALKMGHEVTICTGKSFQTLVEENHLHFIECSLDLMAILQTKEGKMIFEEGMKHPVQAMKYVKETLNPLFRKAMSQYYVACQNQDIIIYHPKALGAVDIAEKLQLPCVSMPMVPMIYPISSFPNLAFTTQSMGPLINRLTYQISNLGVETNNLKDINQFRKDELGMPSRKAGIYMIKRGSKPLPILYPISKKLFPGVKEFEKEVCLTGFPILYPYTNNHEELDRETLDFIQRGKPPVVVTFSSMPLKNPADFMIKLTGALDKTGNRAILLIGNSGMFYKGTDTILVKQFLPHDALFLHAKGIVHHGGVGTMAAALRSGKPQVMMPFQVDQPFWAKRLYDLGYALKPLKENDKQDEFINRFVEMDNKEVIERAKEIESQIRRETPNESAVKAIEEYFRQWGEMND